MKRLILKKKEEDHKHILQSANREVPTMDVRNLSIVKGVRSIPQSSVAALGNTDPSGYSENVRSWIRETQSTDKADSGFFAKTLKPKNSKMWNDSSIPDSAFAPNVNVNDPRQKLKQRESLLILPK
jgi:hypothetical protein